MEYFAGLDVSLEETAICVVDETGALARKLAVILHRIWINGTTFRWGPEPTSAQA